MEQGVESSDWLYKDEGDEMDKWAHRLHPLNCLSTDLMALQEQFIAEVFDAYERYRVHHEWLTLADELWELFVYFIGFERGTKSSSSDEAFIHDLFRADGKNNFLAAIEGSFDAFYSIPKDHSLQLLTRLEGRLKSSRDFDALSLSLRDEMRRKYDFFISRINDEIRNHERRSNDDLLRQTVADGDSPVTINSFEDFCLQKIKQLPEDERERFLAINTGDRSFYAMGVAWKQEYNRISGKALISEHKAPLSRAKRRYRER